MSTNRITALDLNGTIQFPEDTQDFAHAVQLNGTITLEDGSTVTINTSSATVDLLDTDVTRNPNTIAAWNLYHSIAKVLQAQIGMGMVKTNQYDPAGLPAIFSFNVNGFGAVLSDWGTPLAGQDISDAYGTLLYTLRTTNPAAFNLHNPALTH